MINLKKENKKFKLDKITKDFYNHLKIVYPNTFKKLQIISHSTLIHDQKYYAIAYIINDLKDWYEVKLKNKQVNKLIYFIYKGI